jgi:integrase/recombinase XerD
MSNEIIMEHGLHKNKIRLFLKFDYDEYLAQVVKALPDALWSQTKKAWHIPYHVEMPDKLKLFFTEQGIQLNYINEFMELPRLPLANPRPGEALPGLTAIHIAKLKVFLDWMRSRRYSESTVNTYMDALKTFLRYYSAKVVSEISNDDLIEFNNTYILKNKLSLSYQNQVVNAIKLFYRAVELRSLDVELIYRPKREHVLPNVLSKEEVRAILNAHSNIKHKAMLSLIYSCGLRRSELLNLKLNDIDSKRGLVIIRKAKGKKDRVAPLSDKMLQLLRDYFVACRPRVWLFEGQEKNGQYDQSSLAKVLKQALDKTKINKPVTLHWLRHSYATHLLENGTDLRYIQEILGHSSSRTTEIYTHVSNKSIQTIVSPFDTL